MFFDFFSNQKWFRRLYGGEWFYNRHWHDMGRVCIFQWEKTDTGRTSGRYCTIRKEEYKVKFDPFLKYFCNL